MASGELRLSPLLIVAAFFALPASPPEPLIVSVSAPAGFSLPAFLEIHWIAEDEDLWFTPEKRQVERGRLSLTPPQRAESLVVSGSGLASRQTSLEEARRSGIKLLRGGTVLLEAASPIRQAIRVWIVDESGSMSDRRFDPLPSDGQTVAFLLSPGRYGIGVDQGADTPLTYSVELVNGNFLIERKLPGPGGEPVTIAVRDRSTGGPLGGAWFSSLDREPLVAILRARVPPAGADGLLRFGRIDPRLLRNLQVEAKGRRAVPLADQSSEESVHREVSLPPFQSLEVKVEGLTPERLASKPPISIGLCRSRNAEMACPPEDWVSAVINPDGKALFRSVAPGRYLLQPTPAAQKDGSHSVDISARPTEPDVAKDWFTLHEYIYRGRVRFADGRPAEVDVRATAVRRQPGDGDELSRTRASGDGSFEMRFVTSRLPTISAVSDDSSARGQWRDIFRREEKGVWSGEIVLFETSLELTLKDRSTRHPLPDCVLQLFWTESSTPETESSTPERPYGISGVSFLKSASDGRATFKGFRGGRVRVIPECAGHARTNGFELTVGAEEKKEEELLLDGVSDFTLRVVDASGNFIRHARVLAHVVDQSLCSAGDCYSQLGSTNEREEVLVSGDAWSGVPLYVVAPGSRLFVGRFGPRLCEVKADCTYTVPLSSLSTFAGLAVRASAGLTVGAVTFSLNGVAIPPSILKEAVRASGISEEELHRQEGHLFVSYVPRLLCDGEYQVSAWVYDVADARRGRSVSLGVLRLPATKRVEFAVPDSEKKKN
jgi:hypothetical protein